ncbi:uncharacterized protein LOC134250306 isoform X2 [Saccostrea cucullata]|uniref:uncharacterized protein LOC134250306 isoform X2 n=1 Tax=Saccostrea cuccullata TaxID=36930 RepID=UPI002ED12B17
MALQREARANLPSVQNCIGRINSLLDNLRSQATSESFDANTVRSSLSDLRRNIERLESAEVDVSDLFECLENLTTNFPDPVTDPDVQDTQPCLSDDNIQREPSSTGRGRHRLQVDMDKLKELIDLGFSVTAIAKNGLLGGKIHPNTIYNRLKDEDKTVRSKYSNLNDDELTTLIRTYNRDHPNAGSEEVLAALKVQGVLIPRKRCRELLSNVDPVGTATRWSRTIQRRQYCVPSANFLWHVDTHHSLIRWNIVVHGGIDGYSRMITYLRASSCNTSKGAACFFLKGVNRYGIPSRVRADSGREFVDVGRFMTAINGTDRGSFITGKSVHNQRIERLWRDVYMKVLVIYYRLFHYMEDKQVLDVNNPVHRFALHYTFIPRIDAALKDWSIVHNNHRLRTENNKTPQMIWLESLAFNANSNSTAVKNTQDDQMGRLPERCEHLNISNDEKCYLKPRDECPLSETDRERLDEAVNVMKDSESYGLDIFGEVMDILSSHI